MNINAIQNQMINHKSFNHVQKSKESLPSVPDSVQAVSEAPETENSAEGQKGVIRLLQEGHFKGVADVRLRINFHDEISAIENEQLKSVADGEIDKFVNTITDFLKSQELKDEDLTAISDTFTAAAEKAKTDFLMEEKPSTDNLLGDLEAAFEDLIAGLNGLIPETVAEAPVPVLAEEIVETVIDMVKEDEPAVVVSLAETEDNTATQIAQLIEELTSLFDAAEDGLTDTLGNTSALPELSEPNGKGGAFEKFLNIYNDLYGIGTAGEPTPSFEIEA